MIIKNLTKFLYIILLIASFETFGKQLYQKPDCIFCKIINRESPSKIIDEDDDVIVFEKRTIRKPVNCLIVPKKHIENFKFIDEKDQYDSTISSKMIFMAKKLSKKLDGSQDFKVTVNNGKNADQTVFHLHMHFKSPYNWKK